MMTAPHTVVLPKEVAKDRQITRYLDGEPCAQGHYGSRWVSGNACYECKRVMVNTRDNSKYAESRKAYGSRPEVLKKKAEYHREGRKTNPEKYAQWDKNKYEKVKGTAKEKARQLEKQKRKYWSNPELFKEKSRAHNAKPEVKERNNARSRQYKQEKPEIQKALNLKHNHKDRAARKQRLPGWLTREDMEYMTGMYKMARCLGLHVDHIIPLQGKFVSGLHVPSNLQLMSPSENCAKKNKYEVCE